MLHLVLYKYTNLRAIWITGYYKMFPSNLGQLMCILCLLMSTSEVMNWDTKQSMKRMLSNAAETKLCKDLLNSSNLRGTIWQDYSWLLAKQFWCSSFPHSKVVSLSMSVAVLPIDGWHSSTVAFCFENTGRKDIEKSFLGGLKSVAHESRCLGFLVVLWQQWMLGPEWQRCQSFL